jgi:thiol-disulfide isomerase/thioredoxin
MKNAIIASSLFLAIPFFGCNTNNNTVPNPQKPSEGYTISGEIGGLTEGIAKLTRRNDDDRSVKTIDSAAFKNGMFHLKGKLDYPQVLRLSIEPGNWSFEVFVENSDIKIKGDTTGSEYYDYTKYEGSKGAIIKNIKVSGSKSQDDWMAFKTDTSIAKFDPLFAELNKAYDIEKDETRQNKIRDRMDSLRDRWNANQLAWISHFVGTHPGSVSGAYIFSNFYLYNQHMRLDTMEFIVKTFSSPASTSDYYTYLSKELAKRKALTPGHLAPDFTLLKRDSTSFTLSSTRGRYVMLDFWASWCVPCREAIPHWKSVYAKYHSQGFDIISITDDDKWKNWIKAMDQEKMPWLQIADEFPYKNRPAKVGELYMTTFIPFYVLLDKDGKILSYTGSEKEIDTQLEKLFNKSTLN